MPPSESAKLKLSWAPAALRALRPLSAPQRERTWVSPESGPLGMSNIPCRFTESQNLISPSRVTEPSSLDSIMENCPNFG